MFNEELNFFISHQNELLSKYQGKVLVIKGQTVVGVYQNPLEAYFEAQKKYDIGTFMIQPCDPGSEAYTVTIN